MKLERIKINGFKSINALDLQVRPINILIGKNGAGKSVLLDVFRLLNELSLERLQLYVGKIGGSPLLFCQSRSTVPRIEIEVCFSHNNFLIGYRCSLISSPNDRVIFEHEDIFYQNKKHYAEPLTQRLGSNHYESRLRMFAQHNNISNQILKTMQNLRVYYFHDTSDFSKIKQTVDLDDNHYLRHDGSNLSAYLYLLQQKEPQVYKNIIETIRLVNPFFKDFNLHPSLLNPNKIKLEWYERNSTVPLTADMISNGTLRFICLCTLLHQPTNYLPGVILLDEPELSLHPYAITLLASLLRNTSNHTPVIIATHSTTLVNQFNAEDIIVVKKENNYSTFLRLKPETYQSELSEYR